MSNVNYNEKHKFEPSGRVTIMEQPECVCGLPEDIPTMHIQEKQSNQMSKWRLQTIPRKIKPIILNMEFKTKEEAERFAEWNASNRPDVDWRDVYEVVEETK